MKKLPLLFLGLLMIQLSVAQTPHTLTIRSRPSNSTFAYLVNAPAIDPGTHSAAPSLVIADWTNSGLPYVWRSFLKYDLSAIPTGAVIDSAFLSLYANPTSPSGNPGSPTWGTDNASGIYRLTATWDVTTLTWATQPGYSTSNSALLPQSTSWIQNYLHTDVTNLVKDMITYGNYGMLFKHIQETTPLNSMIFYSPNEFATDSTLTPKLVIYYRYSPAGISNVNNSAFSVNIFPNPANTAVNIIGTKEPGDEIYVTIMDCAGRIVANANVNDNRPEFTIPVDLKDYAKGMYIVRLRNSNGNTITEKLTVN